MSQTTDLTDTYKKPHNSQAFDFAGRLSPHSEAHVLCYPGQTTHAMLMVQDTSELDLVIPAGGKTQVEEPGAFLR